jgi:ATP-binding cassette subfamily F protein uup
VGGYNDYLRQRPTVTAEKKAAPPKPEKKGETAVSNPKRLGFNEKREYELLPAQIEKLTKEIQQAEAKLENPDFYQKHPQEFTQLSQWLLEARHTLDQKELRWLELAEKAGDS